MPLELLPMDQDEIGMYLKVCWDSFGPGIMGLMYPDGFSEAAQKHAVAETERSNVHFPGRSHRFKVVDTDLPADDPFDKVVGVSHWQMFLAPRSDEDLAREKAWNEQDRAAFGRTPGLNVPFVEAFHGVEGALKKRHVGGKPHVYLQALATRAGHSRRGIGAIHLKWGTQKADELGLPAYLEASPQGWPLYKRWGWVDLERLAFNGMEWGWDDGSEHWVMWREPK